MMKALITTSWADRQTADKEATTKETTHLEGELWLVQNYLKNAWLIVMLTHYLHIWDLLTHTPFMFIMNI
jgi:hypothetical protein